MIDLSNKNFRAGVKRETRPTEEGFEPSTFGLEVQRAIHCATRPLCTCFSHLFAALRRSLQLATGPNPVLADSFPASCQPACTNCGHLRDHLPPGDWLLRLTPAAKPVHGHNPRSVELSNARARVRATHPLTRHALVTDRATVTRLCGQFACETYTRCFGCQLAKCLRH